MTLAPLPLRPGISKLDSEYGSEGRWVDGDKVRFVGEQPEKIGGWGKLLETALTGTGRSTHPWRDNSEFRRLAIGTHKKLVIFAGGEFVDITPLTTVTSSTLSNPFTTSSGSRTVSVAHTSHGQKDGDNVVFSGGSAVGGLTIEGPYVIAVTNANAYTITHVSAASASVAGGGGTVSYKTFRGSLSDPFATTDGSATVTVTHNSHARNVGDYVEFDDASAVGGITVDGEYTVASVVDANSYTITHGSAATSTASGGGTVSYRYDISIGLVDSIVAAGYGVGGYGGGTYGTARDVSVTLACRTWALDNFGANLLALPRGGDLYEWLPTQGGRATPVTNAPEGNLDMFVTEERIITLLGAGGDKLNVKWCDAEDQYTWTAAVTNDAGEKPVNAGNELIGGGRVRGAINLIQTDTAAFIQQYTADDFVYSFRLVGDKCGLFGPNATVVLNGARYWMSDSNFYVFDGTVPRPLPSDAVRDYVFGDINRTQRNKCFAYALAQFGEVWFLYCSEDSDEIDRYVMHLVGTDIWSVGTIARTAGVDRSIFPLPIMVGADGFIYEHETGHDADGAAMESYITSAPVDVGEGDVNMDINAIIPDFKRIAGTVEISLLTRPYPAGDLTTNGPYSATSSSTKLDCRVDGRQAAIKYRSNEIGGDFRLGRTRLDISPQGDR